MPMKSLIRISAALVIALCGPTVRAQGIPVIDIANLTQTIMQVMNDITEIENQVQQITQLQSQVNSINGMRNLGNVFNSPALQNYVPPDAYTALNAVTS